MAAEGDEFAPMLLRPACLQGLGGLRNYAIKRSREGEEAAEAGRGAPLTQRISGILNSQPAVLWARRKVWENDSGTELPQVDSYLLNSLRSRAVPQGEG